jgi:hypothetical protein
MLAFRRYVAGSDIDSNLAPPHSPLPDLWYRHAGS